MLLRSRVHTRIKQITYRKDLKIMMKEIDEKTLDLFGGRIDSAKHALKKAIGKLNDNESTLYKEILNDIERRNQNSFKIKLLGGQIDAMIFALETQIDAINKSHYIADKKGYSAIYQNMLDELN